jgi:hypothetical protein
MIHRLEDIQVSVNVELLMRERGKVVPGSRRIGHNILTTFGKNWLSKLVGWSAFGTDVPFTNRRVRWMGVGGDAQEEVPGIVSLGDPLRYDEINYLAQLDSVEFPTTSSVRFNRTFSENEITTVPGVPVEIREIGLFADVIPGTSGASEDSGHTLASDPILNPAVPTHTPVAYKSFELITKTQDFVLEAQWDFRF